MAKSKRKGKKQGNVVLVFAAIVVIFTAIFYFRQNSTSNQGGESQATGGSVSQGENADNLTIDYLDVGQGNSTLLMSKEVNILIDGGERGNGATVEAALDKYNIDTLDYVIATHPHSDHIGGIVDLMYDKIKGDYNIDIKNIVMSDLDNSIVPTSKVYEYFLKDADEINANIIIPEQKESYTFGSVKVDITPSPFKNDKNLNNESLVTIISHGENTFVFTGDAEKKEELELVNEGVFDGVNATVYQAGHHGSATASTDELLDTIKPKYAVISCGVGNSYGHPHRETLDKFSRICEKYFRTDEEGSIEFISDGKNISYSTEK